MAKIKNKREWSLWVNSLSKMFLELICVLICFGECRRNGLATAGTWPGSWHDRRSGVHVSMAGVWECVAEGVAAGTQWEPMRCHVSITRDGVTFFPLCMYARVLSLFSHVQPFASRWLLCPWDSVFRHFNHGHLGWCLVVPRCSFNLYFSNN